ncbi:MAG: MFS transporter [Thalassobaculum sp.]
MSTVTRLQIAGCGLHLADQIALVGVPLAAALAFDASAEVIGILVACQSMAHLLGSLPAGLMVDRGAPRRVALVAVLISLLGFAVAATGVQGGSLIGFGTGVTAAGFGIVLFVLTSLSLLPRAVPAAALAQANARLEIPRAAASFAVPLGLGAAVSADTVAWIFPAALAGGCLALAAVAGLPHYSAGRPSAQSPLRRVLDGGAFVLANEFLLAIAACALFWNFAFSALLVTMVPLITDVYRMDPGVFGLAMAAFGLAAFTGSSLAARVAGRVPPKSHPALRTVQLCAGGSASADGVARGIAAADLCGLLRSRLRAVHVADRSEFRAPGRQPAGHARPGQCRDPDGDLRCPAARRLERRLPGRPDVARDRGGLHFRDLRPVLRRRRSEPAAHDPQLRRFGRGGAGLTISPVSVPGGRCGGSKATRPRTPPTPGTGRRPDPAG